MRSPESGKSRKPYKITKSREKWSDEEHGKFLEAIDRFGRNWKGIVAFVGTRSVSQVRSHAQKHFIRLEKTGLGAGVPPARRKARLNPDFWDGSTDSDQDGCGLNYQANSSSMSSFDYHQAQASAGSGAQCNDCQPVTSPEHSLGSFQSCSSTVSSSPSTSVIAHAQEFLRHCNRTGLDTPPAGEQGSCPQGQGMAPKSRGALLAMLQRIASSQQGYPSPTHSSPSSPVPCSGTVPSSAAVALQQRQLQQLLYQHHQQQQQQQQQPQNVCQAAFTQQNLIAPAQAAAEFGSWPWQPSPPAVASVTAADTPAVVSTVTQPCTSPPIFTRPPEGASALTAYQQACPRLDGSFLAKCIKPSASLPCVSGCNQPIQMPSQLPMASRQVLPASHVPAAAAVPVQLQAPRQPSVSTVSPTLSFSSVPSSTSSISAVPSLSSSPEAQLPVDLRSADALFEPFGLDDEDLWAGLDFEDPLMAVVDAAMGCSVSR